MSSEEISNIINENISLKEFGINWKNKSYNCILDNIEYKCPNLTKLVIQQEEQDKNSNELKLKIIQNSNCNINKIKINNLFVNTKLYCNQFENLVEIEIKLNNLINNIKDSLPIFGDKCLTIFSHLKTFHFSLIKTKEFSMDILKNIYL